MKKIGIVTLNGDFNYGNRLQNFALQQVILDEGMEVDTLIIQEGALEKLKVKFLLGHITGVADIFYLTKKLIGKLTIKQYSESQNYKQMVREKNHVISPFSRRHLSSVYVSQEERDTLNQSYDLFIVGSDQVWNPHVIDFDTTNFLSFASKEKRCSYSASISVSEFPEVPLQMKKHFTKYLNEMAYISVREESGKSIVNQLTNQEVEVAPDPTLLLSQSQWQIFLPKGQVFLGEYLLVYFISPPSAQTLLKINHLAKEKNLIVKHLMGDTHNDNHSVVDPLEFISAIKHAEYLITDSFHGCVFSTIMNTKFLVFERTDKKGTVSRIETLLTTFQLNFALQSETEERLSGDYLYDFDKVNNILDKERKRGNKILKENILSKVR